MLAHQYSGPSGAMLFLHNLDESEATIRVADQLELGGEPEEVLADQAYGALDPSLVELRLAGFGYRWIRLRFTP